MAQARWVRRKILASSRIDGEIVLLEPGSGNYYGLNAVAACVWELLDEPQTLDELVAHVCDRYEVPREQCVRDIQALLGDLSDQNLVERCDA